MKKKHFKRFIAWGFTVLAVFLIASFSVPVQSFADGGNFSLHVTITSTKSGCALYDLYNGSYNRSSAWSSVGTWNYNNWPTGYHTYSDGEVFYFRGYSFADNYDRYYYYNSVTFYLNDEIIYPSSSSSSPTPIYAGDSLDVFPSQSTDTSSHYGFSGSPVYYFIFYAERPTPTPSPTPTPTPEPTPTPSPTQDPTITTDNQFWGKLNQNANGAWSFITQVFQGLFNNVVFRNLAIYLPLIGLIIGLVVYLFTMGGRND